MSVPISGILLDPYGNVARFADIKFVTVQGALDVIESSSAVFRTDENGAYSIDVQFGRFAVLMRFNGNNGAYDKIQTISVNSDTVASTLGELLAYTEPLTPAEILLVQQLVAQAIAAKEDAEAAALAALLSEQNAAASAAAAANSVALLAPVPLNGGVWASGQTLTAYNQYMIYNGEAYSARQETVLPYTVGAVPDLGFVYQIKLNSLQALSGLTEPSDLDSVHTRTFQNVAAMTSFTGHVAGNRVNWQGYYSAGDGGSNWGVVKTGAHTADGGSIFSIDVNTYVEANLKGSSVNGLRFGMRPLGGDCTAQYQAFRDHMASALVNLNKQKARIPTGRYEFSVSPNWAINALELEFSGEVWLINTGTGSSFILDGGASGAGVNGMVIRGYPRVYGGASTQHGYYIRAVHRSDFELNCRGAGSTFSGLYQEWNVSNTIKFIMNFNDGGLYNTPARGVTMTQRAANEETSYCLFINPECSGMPVGIYQDGALGNVVQGGAVQGCSNKGVVQTANSWNNKFYGTDFEVNTNIDIECDGRENQLFGVDCEKKIKFTSNAVNCSVFGGITENIEVDAGASRTLLSGVTYNRFGAGTITDLAATTRYNDVRNKALGEVGNKPRQINDIAVGVSPFTYTNASGQDEDVLITGGTVSQVAFIRLAGYVVPNNGIYKLSPGDSVSVTYTSAPVMKAIPF